MGVPPVILVPCTSRRGGLSALRKKALAVGRHADPSKRLNRDILRVPTNMLKGRARPEESALWNLLRLQSRTVASGRWTSAPRPDALLCGRAKGRVDRRKFS
jgi:hypothetical protein